ncbi:acyl-CoA dehydrogenase [Marinomonas sp. M1K-6]|uniref:3-methylmercaptopropionyl-CoA dehydrogenase n=1 Tax=Marinomonas profundi TaxID=2726122 RepID=A0A847RDP7_9GAMM|nr:acyl-CoA dehydrogenase [Marinomonas profundi]NLQ18350.1 acyl-CoA dehydrogenase [Marinomonas profundi]UDV02412.1 acyl-CoA dehydrogenase [Marinomonas profundi]
MTYQAPYKDMQLLVAQAYQQQGLDAIDAMQGFDPELANAVMEEAAKFASGVLAPLNAVGDVQGCRFQGGHSQKGNSQKGKVTTADGWREAYQQFAESGWIGLALPEAFGGQGLPKYIAQPVNEMWLSANLAFVMFQALAQGGAEILLNFANESIQQRYLPKIVTGEWTVAMALTEPNAGSDLGALNTKAIPQSDGTYKIKGQKIYITYGEHDLTDNIAHLVLARTPDAPAGSRGISLFIVPKHRVTDDGTLGDFNDVRCTGIEHKMGLHGSPTCSMSYGDQDDCIGELVGELNQGLMAMFVLMNEARLSCGLQGVALGELGYQRALAYAKERTQGTNNQGEKVAIVEHADVKRMLLEMRSETFALRALGYQIAAQIDASELAIDETKSNQSKKDRIALLTPIFKAFATERANIMAGQVIQVFGGMGFVEETGVAQIMRDARVTTIYEGTTGIQARDLVFRKVRGDQGKALSELLADMTQLVRTFEADAVFAAMAKETQQVITRVTSLLDSHLLNRDRDAASLQAVSVPFLEAMGILCCAWQLFNVLAYQQTEEHIDASYRQNISALSAFYGAYRLPAAMAALKVVENAGLGLSEYEF